MNLCTECDNKLNENGILSNEELCKHCRERVEEVVDKEVELMNV